MGFLSRNKASGLQFPVESMNLPGLLKSRNEEHSILDKIMTTDNRLLRDASLALVRRKNTVLCDLKPQFEYEL